jgi:hypothetical protein
MANHAVVIANKMAAKDNDAFVRPAVSGQNIDNGNIFSLLGKSSTAGQAEVWDVTVPATGSLVGLWMALEPELPFLANGTRQYNGLGTIQDFYTAASTVFTAVKLVPGDIITLTAEDFASGSTLGYAVAANGKVTWTGAATANYGYDAPAACLRYLNTTYIPSADGSIGGSRIAAYQYEVLFN